MTDIASFFEVGDIVLDATGKPFAIVVSGSYPRLDATPADGVGDAIPAALITTPAVIVARHGGPAEVYVDPDHVAAPSDAPTQVEQG